MFSCCACNRKEKTSTDNDEESSEDSSSSPESSDKVIETVEGIKFTDYVIIPLKDENHVEEEEEEEEKEEEEVGEEITTGSKELSVQKNLEKIIEDVEEITVNVDVINSDDELDEKKNGKDDNQEVAKALEDSINSEETVVDVEEVKGDVKPPQEKEQKENEESETTNSEDNTIQNETIEKNSQEDVTKEIVGDSPEENGHKDVTEELVEEKPIENVNNLSEPVLEAEVKNIITDDPVVPREEENIEEEEYDDMMDLPSPPPEFLEKNLPSPPPEFLENLVAEAIDQKNDLIFAQNEGLNFEEDDQEDICESKESSSSKSSVIMAVSNGDNDDNEVNGHVTLSEMNSPELKNNNIEEKDEELELIKELELMDKNGDIKLIEKNGNNDNEEMSPLSESPNSCEEALNICKIVIEKGVMAPPKSNGLFQAPGYIERTLVDGPDEDGDDSVFERSITAESSAPENEKDSSRLQKPVIRWLSQEDDDSVEVSGMLEPPATPIAKDELALRRHRFFSDLLHATNSSAIHKVHFDPLGPLIHSGCDNDREDHLEELVTRLENVTKRLESVPEKFIVETQEVAIQTQTPSPKRTKKFTGLFQSVDEPTEVVNNGDIQFKNIDTTVIMSIANYQEIIAGPVAEFLQLSRKIGGDVATHSDLVEKAFQIQLQFMKTAASRPAPSSQPEQVSLLGPTSNQIQAIQDFREKHRGSQFFNHLSAISESIPALGWVAVTPTPAPYVKEMNDAGQFYTNRVLKEWKEKDKKHVEWCKAWIQTLSDLQKFIRQHHTTGLVWAKTGSVPAPPPPCGMPPPPPPSMPIDDIEGLDINDDRSALFAQINQGEDITKKLKKVTSDMQTHKNTSLRTGPAPFKAPIVNNSGSIPSKITLPANAPIDKPPVFSRDGKKWLVEYQKGNKNLVVEDAEMNNVVYMYRCQDSTIVIKGKINSVVMDSCRKSSIVFDSLVSSIEFVNCQSVQMQVLGKVPTISIDKTDGCQMYLNSESLNVEVISSKSSEMNVMVPKGNGDYMEYPVPEQFKTTVNPKGLTTICVDSLG